MTPRFSARTLLFLLATSVPVASMTGCSYAKQQLDYFTNDRKPQVVAGGRRMPMLNPQVGAESAPVPQQQAAANPLPQEQTKRAPSFDESPYDHFDNNGNRLDPEELENMPEPGMQTATAEKGPGLFDKMAGFFNDESSNVETLRNQPRKPLVDNTYTPADLGLSDVPAGAKNMEPAVVMPSDQPMYPVDSASGETITTTPPVEISEKREDKNWFERRAADMENMLSSEDTAARDMANEDKPYPQLSTVPVAPLSFETVKEDKNRRMEELKKESAVAEQDRRALYSEPSGQDAMVPVEPSVSVAPAVQPKEGEMLLGHVSDKDVPVTATSQPVVAPKVMGESKEPVASQPAGDNQWWEEWNLFSSKRSNEVMKEQDAKKPTTSENLPATQSLKAAEPMPQVKPAASASMPWQPVGEQSAVPAPAAMQPLVEQPQVQSISAPLEPAAVQEEKGRSVEELMAEGEAEDGALPPTQLLREVKTLPPSRYIGRYRAN